MYLARRAKNTTVRIHIAGWDANHKNTTRLITVYEAEVDEVVTLVLRALEEETRKTTSKAGRAAREPK